MDEAKGLAYLYHAIQHSGGAHRQLRHPMNDLIIREDLYYYSTRFKEKKGMRRSMVVAYTV